MSLPKKKQSNKQLRDEGQRWRLFAWHSVAVKQLSLRFVLAKIYVLLLLDK